jgi:hypothetical protein
MMIHGCTQLMALRRVILALMLINSDGEKTALPRAGLTAGGEEVAARAGKLPSRKRWRRCRDR